MPEAKKKPDHFDAKRDDDSWRRAMIIWHRLAIGVPPGQNAPFIYRIAATLQEYKNLDADLHSYEAVPLPPPPM